MPTSARPRALGSPSLQALVERILEVSLQANRPEEGAHCLAVGASTVVAALWPIDDEVTAGFFAPMYRALGQGQSRAEALRQANLECLKSHPQPYYWAGFTLLGDPR